MKKIDNVLKKLSDLYEFNKRLKTFKLSENEIKGQAKKYQIRQFLKIVEKHDLKLEDNECGSAD